MIQLLWTILNLGLFIYFIVICFKAVKLVHENLGRSSSIILVVGLFSFMCNTGKDYSNADGSAKDKTWEFIPKDSLENNNSKLFEIELEKTLIATHKIGISYIDKYKGQSKVPIRAFSMFSGFQGGVDWSLTEVSVKKLDETKLEYSASTKTAWKLLGISVFTQYKPYHNIVEMKENDRYK